MQQEFQWPAVQAFGQLAQSNMQLFASICRKRPEGSGAAEAANPLAVSVLLMQGMANNYAKYLSALTASALPLFAGSRGMVDYLAKE